MDNKIKEMQEEVQKEFKKALNNYLGVPATAEVIANVSTILEDAFYRLQVLGELDVDLEPQYDVVLDDNEVKILIKNLDAHEFMKKLLFSKEK